MVEINVYKVIDKEDVFFSWMFGEEYSFSADTIHKVFDAHPNEKEFKFNINCDGGSVSEGMRIYDVLRTSGKTLFCNIENGCHSMAVVLLLAAPKENRTANPNARALIHEVRAMTCDVMTAEQLRSLATEVETEQNAILDIYAERTGSERSLLESLMKEEKQRTAQELIDLGFISKINIYTTNSKNKGQMSKPELKIKTKNVLQKIMNLLGGEIVNYDFKDADGNVLFSTDKEDDSLAVGDAVTIPDGSTEGTFTLEDGRTVTIAEGKVSEIKEADVTDEKDERIAELENALEEAGEVIAEQETEITNLKSQVRSKFNIAPRKAAPGRQNANPNNPDSKTLKAELKDKRNLAIGGKK